MNKKIFLLAGFVTLAAVLAVGVLMRGQNSTSVQPGPMISMSESRPDFTLKDAAGADRSISEWDGSAMVVNFWATWCAPCRREIPLLNALQSEYRDAGVQVIGVAVDFREDVLAFLDEMPIDYPVLIGEQEAIDAAEAFGMDFIGLPLTAFTDHQGHVVHLHLGEVHREQAEIVFAAIAQLREGRIDLDSARRQIGEQIQAAANQ
jgi:thiol-disulfide isomerase/thioredoxin